MAGREKGVKREGSIIAVLFFGLAAALFAHPPVGIVMDRLGNVFYSDLERVWMIAPDGKKSVAVPGVHTHDLGIDASGNIYGEHLWYEGDATKQWGHRVWRRTPQGRVTDVIPARRGFPSGYGFARDGSGAIYWTDKGTPARFFKQSPSGEISTVAVCRDCREVRWMTATSDGTVYFIDAGEIKELSPAGRFRTRTSGLARRRWTQPQVNAPHRVMGVWTDGARNVYAAVYGSREVVKVSRDGRAQVVATSRLPWSPTGGMVAANGDLWIVECSYTNAIRVRRIARDGKVTVF
jgi:sugar lactone lactonase YvrE